MFFNNLITAETRRKNFANIPLIKQTFYKLQARHKTQKSLDYIHSCIQDGLWPTFLKISEKNKKQIG